ncbi:MAG: hypothetical protein GX774_20320 [Armatimonadetes bacterium]|jgi:hypothetical protein|nr:hypothetical protein [Armatimonadota bacterium]
MKKIHRAVPDVPQHIADQGCEILERYFNRYGVTRALHLPEPAKVELLHELRGFYSVELPQTWLEKAMARAQHRSWWERFVVWLREAVGLE